MAGALRRITPVRVASQVVPVGPDHDLFEVEAHGIADAVAKRRNEFAAGRSAARLALGCLGQQPVAIPRKTDRQPLWPEGFVGSISHSGRFAAAIAGYGTEFAGLGLDIEGAAPLSDGVRRHVLTPEERDRFDASPRAGAAPRCKLSFIAKEALFKAVYPITGRFFGFQDARIDVDPDGTWSAAMADPPPFAQTADGIVRGRWAAAAGMLIAVVCIDVRS